MPTRLAPLSFAALASLLVTGCGGSAAAVTAPAGPAAPDFEYRPADGAPAFRLSSLRGQVVVLKFWATWCSDCVREMPLSKQLHERFAGKRVVFLGLAGERKAGAAEVLAAARQHGNDFPQMLDLKETAEGGEKVASRYQVSWIPTVLVVGPDGRLLHAAKSLEGEAFEATAKVIEAALGGA